jgi:peptidoglycan/LPS O-acetylase OafA/YrhL
LNNKFIFIKQKINGQMVIRLKKANLMRSLNNHIMKWRNLTGLLALVLLFSSCVIHTDSPPAYVQPMYYGPGIGLGTLIAVIVSWSRNKSILWAIVHGILGWFYVIYAILVKKQS